MANDIKCTCGHSWSKASSSKKDMYVCHICGKDNTMKDGGWLDNYGKKPNPNEVDISVGPGFVGMGNDITGRNYSPAWGGQFAMGGSMPGAVGFTYARVAGSAPSNGKYAKKTKASAQNGKEMKFYQEGLDFKPNSIAQDGEAIVDPMGQWAHPGEVTIIPGTDITMEGVDYPVLGISDTGDQQMMYPGENYDFDGEYVTEYPMMQEGGWLSKYQDGGGVLSRSNLEMMSALEKDIKNQKARSAQETISQYTPKPGDKERMNAAKDAYRAEQAKLLNRAASSRVAAKAMENIVEPMLAIEMGMGAGKLAKPALEAAGKYLTEKTALKNAYKLNPYAFKPTEGMMYRGLGKEGMEDALASGVFRAKQDVEPSMVGNFDFSKKFNKAYYSPEFNIADQYGQGYIAEVPRSASDWAKRYGKKEWSQIAQRDIPTTEGKILQKDWLRGYKEVPKKNDYSKIEFESIPYNELNKTLYHGGYKVIPNVKSIKTTREGMIPGKDLTTATSPTSRGFYTSQYSWMPQPGPVNPLRETEGLYNPRASESAQKYAYGSNEGYIHAGDINPDARIVDWNTFQRLPILKEKGIYPDFRRLSREATEIAENLGIHGFKDVDEYNILNPKRVFKSFKPVYKDVGKGWERYANGGWLTKYK